MNVFDKHDPLNKKPSRLVALERQKSRKASMDSFTGSDSISGFDSSILGPLAGLGSTIFGELTGANKRAADLEKERIASQNKTLELQAALAARDSGKSSIMPWILGAVGLVVVTVVLIVVFKKK